MEVRSNKPIEVFFCYAHQDEVMRSQLEKHLRIMQRQGLITAWHDRKVNAGEEWEQEVTNHLNEANIILLLISPDFMNSEYCYSFQMKHALKRHEKGESLVIPILLRSVDWEDAPFKKLKALPTNKKFVARWRSRDDAFTDIARGIRDAIKTLSKTLPIDSDKLSSKGTKKTLYCDNCKAPVTLPTFCSWCGLFPMQICGECLEKNSINRETCQKCDASLILVCNNCETKNSLEADFCRSCGLQLRLFCSECREKNLSDREACQKCGVALIQLCSHCNQKNSLEAELCLRCGMPLVQVCITCGAFNDMESATCWGCRELLNIDYSSEVPFIIFRQGVF